MAVPNDVPGSARRPPVWPAFRGQGGYGAVAGSRSRASDAVAAIDRDAGVVSMNPLARETSRGEKS